MGAIDPFQQPGAEPGEQVRPRPLPQAQPLPQGRSLPQAQAVPQGQIVRPAAQPVGRAGPVAAQPVSPAGVEGLVTIRTRDEDSEPEEEFSSAAIKRSPPWLVSAVFHMAMLIVLGLIAVAIQQSDRVRLNVSASEEEEEELEDIWAEELGKQLEFESPLEQDDVDAAEEPVLTPDNLPEVEDPFAAPPELEVRPDGTAMTSDIHANMIGLALKGREEGTKKSLLGRYGGTRLTQEAVLRGLEWLARNQRTNGSWSLSGPYHSGVPEDLDNMQAATAMALLAFQGDGHTHRKGKFKRNVVRGWKWLRKEQDADGCFYHEGPFNHRFYTHGQCAIAACELYAMTDDPAFKGVAEKAIRYCIQGQSPKGGWRYSPQSDSDVSVTGWILMALQSARMAGMEVPAESLQGVERFLDRVAKYDGARYPYQRGGQVRLAMTAEALLMRQYLGWKRSDPRLVAGMEWVTSPGNLIDFEHEDHRDVYYWYYATQAAHHMEGDYWKRWNGVMRQVLPERQVKRGRESGSWDPERPVPDKWAHYGGRLYVTCLSIYMLEVYYRHLPLYTKVYTDLLKSGRTPGTL